MEPNLIILQVLFFSFSISAFATEISCFEQICGKKEEFKNFPMLVEDDLNRSSEQDEIFKSRLNEKLEILIQNQKEKWQLRYDYFKNINERIGKSFSGFPMFFHTALTPVIDNFQILYEKEVIETLNFSTALIFFDENKARVVLADKYSENELDWVVRINKEFYRDERLSRFFIFLLTKNFPENTFNSVLSNYDISAFQALNVDLENSLKRIEQIDLGNLNVFEQKMFQAISKKAQSLINLNEFPRFVFSEINSNLFILELVANYFLSSQDKFSTLVREVPASLIEKYKQVLLNVSVDEMNPSLLPSEKMDLTIEKARKDCIDGALSLAKVSPSLSQVNQVRIKLNNIQNNAIHFVNKNFGHSLGDYVDQKFSLLQFNLPATRGFVEDYILGSLHDSDAFSDEYFDENILLDSNNYQKNDDDSYFDLNIVDQCMPFQIENFLDDKVNVTNNRPTVNVSAVTAKHFEKFEMVFAHEIGHFVYQLLKGSTTRNYDDFPSSEALISKIQEKITCISENHPNAPKEDFVIDLETDFSFKSGYYSSEDFADLFAASVAEQDAQNSFCYLIFQNDSNGLDLNLMNSEPTDPHSATFYRVLNTEKILKGQLSRECEEIVAAQPNVTLKSCFK
jgi:hypothetical protein